MIERFSAGFGVVVRELGIFFGGFISPAPLFLLAVAAAVVVAAVWARDGQAGSVRPLVWRVTIPGITVLRITVPRMRVGMAPSLARRDWDAAHRRRVEVEASQNASGVPSPPS
ncbi:MAG: hypothetical protein LBD77_01065 [Bifidobacteriaceae bacterium]|jgi:hypothetical protein|nr:hypothetical protein [Bifidobacteriaceae bacterium]